MTDELQLPEVMPLADAAERLGVSVRTLERARDAGELVASRLAARGCWVVTREALLAWVAARQTPRTTRRIVPTSGASRDAARVALDLRGRAARGPLTVTDDMGRAA